MDGLKSFVHQHFVDACHEGLRFLDDPDSRQLPDTPNAPQLSFRSPVLDVAHCFPWSGYLDSDTTDSESTHSGSLESGNPTPPLHNHSALTGTSSELQRPTRGLESTLQQQPPDHDTLSSLSLLARQLVLERTAPLATIDSTYSDDDVNDDGAISAFSSASDPACSKSVLPVAESPDPLGPHGRLECSHSNHEAVQKTPDASTVFQNAMPELPFPLAGLFMQGTPTALDDELLSLSSLSPSLVVPVSPATSELASDSPPFSPREASQHHRSVTCAQLTEHQPSSETHPTLLSSYKPSATLERPSKSRKLEHYPISFSEAAESAPTQSEVSTPNLPNRSQLLSNHIAIKLEPGDFEPLNPTTTQVDTDTYQNSTDLPSVRLQNPRLETPKEGTPPTTLLLRDPRRRLHSRVDSIPDLTEKNHFPARSRDRLSSFSSSSSTQPCLPNDECFLLASRPEPNEAGAISLAPLPTSSFSLPSQDTASSLPVVHMKIPPLLNRCSSHPISLSRVEPSIRSPVRLLPSFSTISHPMPNAHPEEQEKGLTDEDAESSCRLVANSPTHFAAHILDECHLPPSPTCRLEPLAQERSLPRCRKSVPPTFHAPLPILSPSPSATLKKRDDRPSPPMQQQGVRSPQSAALPPPAPPCVSSRRRPPHRMPIHITPQRLPSPRLHSTEKQRDTEHSSGADGNVPMSAIQPQDERPPVASGPHSAFSASALEVEVTAMKKKPTAQPVAPAAREDNTTNFLHSSLYLIDDAQPSASSPHPECSVPPRIPSPPISTTPRPIPRSSRVSEARQRRLSSEAGRLASFASPGAQFLLPTDDPVTVLDLDPANSLLPATQLEQVAAPVWKKPLISQEKDDNNASGTFECLVTEDPLPPPISNKRHRRNRTSLVSVVSFGCQASLDSPHSSRLEAKPSPRQKRRKAHQAFKKRAVATTSRSGNVQRERRITTSEKAPLLYFPLTQIPQHFVYKSRKSLEIAALPEAPNDNSSSSQIDLSTTAVVPLADVQSSVDPEIEELERKKTHGLVRPRRIRQRPLRWWLLERLEYSRPQGSDCPVPVGVHRRTANERASVPPQKPSQPETGENGNLPLPTQPFSSSSEKPPATAILKMVPSSMPSHSLTTTKRRARSRRKGASSPPIVGSWAPVIRDPHPPPLPLPPPPPPKLLSARRRKKKSRTLQASSRKSRTRPLTVPPFLPDDDLHNVGDRGPDAEHQDNDQAYPGTESSAHSSLTSLVLRNRDFEFFPVELNADSGFKVALVSETPYFTLCEVLLPPGRSKGVDIPHASLMGMVVAADDEVPTRGACLLQLGVTACTLSREDAIADARRYGQPHDGVLVQTITQPSFAETQPDGSLDSDTACNSNNLCVLLKRGHQFHIPSGAFYNFTNISQTEILVLSLTLLPQSPPSSTSTTMFSFSSPDTAQRIS